MALGQLSAQKTMAYSDYYEAYNRALALFDQEQYVAARQGFEELIERERPYREAEIDALQVNAEYYLAVSAFHLLNPDAEALLKRFITAHPKSNRTNLSRFFLGRYYYNRNNRPSFDAAIEAFEGVDISELDKQQREDYDFQLGFSYFSRQRFAEAKPLLNRARRYEFYYYPAHYYSGFIAYSDGDFDAALADFEKVSGSELYSRAVPFFICSIYYLKGQYRKAIEYIEGMPSTANLLYDKEINQLLGKALFEMEQYDRALTYLEAYAAKTRKLPAEDIFQLGFTQFKLGKYKASIEQFEQLVREEDSLGHQSLYYLGLAYLELNDLANARRFLGEAGARDELPFLRESALFHEAKLSYQLGFSAQAITALKTFLTDYSKSRWADEAREILTNLFLSSQNYTDALEMIQSMKEKSPGVIAAWQKVAYYRGIELLNDGRMTEAANMFKTSLKNPVDPGIQALCYYWKAEVDMKAGEYAAAASGYHKFMDINRNARELPPQSTRATAAYNLGYAYFKQENFASGLTYFKRATAELTYLPKGGGYTYVRQSIEGDILLRTADCHFKLNQRDEALDLYREVIRANPSSGVDYALYQKGMIEGVQRQYAAKVASMRELLNRFPNSLYFQDALYQTANTYFQRLDDHDMATRLFQQLVDLADAKAVYRRDGLMKLAQIAYRSNDDQAALRLWQRVAEEFPNTKESEVALRQIRKVSIEIGNPELYIEISGADIDEQDSVRFRTAETYYLNGDCEEAIKALDRYLREFSEGYFTLAARYYRGNCLYEKKAYLEALPDYEHIAAQETRSDFSETAFLRAAKINHFLIKDFAEATKYYQLLAGMATLPENVKAAHLGLVECHFKTGDFEATRRSAEELRNLEKLSQADRIEAWYYDGRAAEALLQMEAAMQAYQKLADLTSNERGVEARYRRAALLFQKKDLDACETACDKIVKNHTSYAFWLVKTYVLLGDIYVERKEFHQARATYQSVLNYYEGDEGLINEVRAKLERVEQELDKDSRIKNQDDEIGETEE